MASTIKLIHMRTQVVNESASAVIEELADAATAGDLAKVKSLIPSLDAPSQLNVYNSKGLTPLGLASYNGHCNIVSFLLQQHADVNQPDFYGMTAISYASEKGFASVLQILIEAGANVDWMDENNLGLSALHIAACKGQTEVTKLLIQAGANINAQDYNGVSILHCAVGNGHAEVVKCLLQANVKLNAVGSTTNRTPLFLAIDIHHKDIVQMLLAHRARTNVQDTFGLTPLAAACLQKKDDLVELILATRANVNIPDFKKFLPLHYVARSGNLHLVRKLLDAGSQIDFLNDHFESPLHLAVRAQHVDIVRELIDRGCNADVCEPYAHVTALHVAVNSYSDAHMFECVLELLIRGGATLDSRAFTSLESPLYRAINLGKEDLALVLLQHGASVNLDCPFDVTVLQKTCQKLHLELVEAVLHCDLDWTRETWLLLDKHSSGYADLSLLADYQDNVPISLHNNVDLYFRILEIQHNPVSLMRSCRRVLRSSLQSNLLYKLKTLNLPPRLVDFIMLKIV